MKAAFKILAFAVAFAAIGQSVYKAHADQVELNYLDSLSSQERVELLLAEKVSFENAGEDFPSAKRRALSKALKNLLNEMNGQDSVLAIKEKPAI